MATQTISTMELPPETAVPAQATTPGKTLLDGLMPEFDFGNDYERVVVAPPARVSEAVEAYRLDGSLLIRLLFRLRGIPVPGILRGLSQTLGFTLLGEEAGKEIVFGIAGRFWALNEVANLISVPGAQAFRDFDMPGTAKAAMNFRCDALPNGTTRLSMETRVKCIDGKAYRRFRFYWALIKPFSGWIRLAMLRGIGRIALERE